VESESAAVDALLDWGSESTAEALSYFPDVSDYELGTERHLRLVEKAAARFDVPVVASLNGTSVGGWVHYARRLAEAGADALELNLYDVVVDPALSAADVEGGYLELVAAVRAEVRVPLAVKIGPQHTAPLHFVRALEAAGADGVVLFNRFYQPDINLDTLDATPALTLSSPDELRLRVHWIGILSGQVGCSLAATGGVDRPEDVVKPLLAGANAVMTTSALLRHGPGHVRHLLDGLVRWMEDRDYTSVEQLIGSVSRLNVGDPHAYERANYARVIHSWAWPAALDHRTSTEGNG